MRKRKRLAKEKVKHWKKALREYDQVSEQDIVTPVEQQAREALEALDAAQPDLQSLYENLAAAENPEDAIRAFFSVAAEHYGLLQKLLNSQKRVQIERMLLQGLKTTMSSPPAGTT